MLQFVHLDLDKIFKQLEREKNQKKNKKMRERTDVYGCTGVRGGRGIARSWLYRLCCTTTVYNARLLRCIWL